MLKGLIPCGAEVSTQFLGNAIFTVLRNALPQRDNRYQQSYGLDFDQYYCAVFCPERAIYLSPGQRPGLRANNHSTSPEGATVFWQAGYIRPVEMMGKQRIG